MPGVKPGEKIPLFQQLFDDDATKFIEAEVKDDTGAAIPGSPVTLTNDGGGSYSDLSLTYPSASPPAFVSATYRTFNDVGLTVRSLPPDGNHGTSSEIYERLIPIDEITEILSKVCTILANLSGSGSDLVAVLEDGGDIKAVLEDGGELKGNIEC